MKGILCWVILTRYLHVHVIGEPAPPSHWNFKHVSDRHWFGACTCWPLAGIPPSFPSASLVCSAGEVVRAAWPLVVPLWMARSDAARETDSSVWWNGTENMIYSLHALTPTPAEEESGEGSWEVGREAWREEELEDRQDLYLQCCKLILHFIDALFNQWQYLFHEGLPPVVGVSRARWPYTVHNFLAISSKDEIDHIAVSSVWYWLNFCTVFKMKWWMIFFTH